MDNNSPKAGDRVTFSHPEVMDGKTYAGKLKIAYRSLVFVPDELYHGELKAEGFQPECGFIVIPRTPPATVRFA
jgi:hypothetical protein